MNIKILDSWLREYLKTEATPAEIAEKLSLTSLSVERIEKVDKDFLYEFEITTNRPDLYSVLGIAREANAILPRFEIKSEFKEPAFRNPDSESPFPIEILNDRKLVNRICAVVLEIKVDKSPQEIKDRLEKSGIRSLNNIIDVTNYVMRVTGHPAHVFDLDRLNTKKLYIKQAKQGDEIETLDKKRHKLLGGEIVAIDDKGRIVDLLGIMGLENSVVTSSTKRILLFLDNNNPYLIRKASMSLAIRTEAATLNEKGIDPQLTINALDYAVELYEKLADGKVISKVLDIYPNKPEERIIEVSLSKINKVIGVDVDIRKIISSFEKMGFKVNHILDKLKVEVPSFRSNDILIEEDVIEEIARIFGYHNLPSYIPSNPEVIPHPFASNFYWEDRAKNSLKYWGFTETYTYSFVSEDMYEGELGSAVKIKNPLNEDFVYMRNTLIPSLLRVIKENKSKDEIKIFELSNIYLKNANNLPDEILTLAGAVRKKNVSFYEIKGLVEQLLEDFGIKNYIFKTSQKSALGASVYLGKEYIGEIEIFDLEIVVFELNFLLISKYANLRKVYKKLRKFPPIFEDLSFVLSDEIQTQDIIEEIKIKSSLITNVSLKDQFKDTRTFHIVYQSEERNLESKEISQLREKIILDLETKFKAKIK